MNTDTTRREMLKLAGYGTGAALLTPILSQLAARCVVKRLGRELETARDRPHAGERLLAAAHEQHRQGTVDHREDHDVDRDRERRVVGGVIALRGIGRHDLNICRMVLVVKTNT